MYRRVCRSARPLTRRVLTRWTVGAIAALLLPVVASSVGAQGAERGAVAGTVVDDSTGAPIARVTVLLVGTTRGTLTDESGRFVLGDIPAGSHTLRARILSHRQRDVAVTVVAGDTSATTIRLVVAPVTLGVVRARARAPERDRFELAPNVGTVSLTPSAVSGVPAIGEPDVLRTVQLLPGVNARNDFSSGYNVRGGESDQNLILLDGYPIYNPFHLGGLFSTFLEETVGEIELLTGGFGARHGGRLSSVLDVRSAEPARTGLHGSAGISVDGRPQPSTAGVATAVGAVDTRSSGCAISGVAASSADAAPASR